MGDSREVIGGMRKQGVDESIAYVLLTKVKDTSGVYIDPTSVTAVKAYSYAEATGLYTDVSSTLLTGSASLSGRYITAPLFGGATLAEGTRYRIEFKYVANGNTLEDYVWVMAER
jgi:hypothetical protein